MLSDPRQSTNWPRCLRHVQLYESPERHLIWVRIHVRGRGSGPAADNQIPRRQGRRNGQPHAQVHPSTERWPQAGGHLQFTRIGRCRRFETDPHSRMNLAAHHRPSIASLDFMDNRTLASPSTDPLAIWNYYYLNHLTFHLHTLLWDKYLFQSLYLSAF